MPELKDPSLLMCSRTSLTGETVKGCSKQIAFLRWVKQNPDGCHALLDLGEDPDILMVSPLLVNCPTR